MHDDEVRVQRGSDEGENIGLGGVIIIRRQSNGEKV